MAKPGDVATRLKRPGNKLDHNMQMTETSMRSHLTGFGFSGYRSFSGESVRFGPLGAFNVLAAQNNSGKSNVLRFVQYILPQITTVGPDSLSLPSIVGLDLPQGGADQTFRFSLALTKETIDAKATDHGRPVTLLPCFQREDDDLFWIDFEPSTATGGLVPSTNLVAKAIEQYGQDWQHNFHQALNEMGGGAVDPNDVMRRVIGRLAAGFTPPPVATITASRRIEMNASPNGSDNIHAGLGVIHSLAALQNPPAETWVPSKNKFEAINRFAQTVMDDPSVRIHVPFNRDTILIETSAGTLPLDNVGTGIHEVVMFAAGAVTRDQYVFCIEEPETHLHPILQRKLAHFLTHETTNQYLVATHSAQLLNYTDSTIFHLTIDEGRTALTGVKKPNELAAVCADLGYRPSDLLQANAVIWVEGPADRIYLRRWIELADPSLSIDLDYSIMIYGGSTLNHLSVDDDALDDFINLRRLNRHSTVLIDSDRTIPQARLNATKRRLRDEFDSDESQGFAWITDGYTIENYVPTDKLQAAVSAVHPNRKLTGSGSKWSNPLAKEDGKSFDKVAIARAASVLIGPDDLNTLNLKARVNRIVSFIRTANGA